MKPIDKKQFVKLILNEDDKAFVIQIVYFALKMSIH